MSYEIAVRLYRNNPSLEHLNLAKKPKTKQTELEEAIVVKVLRGNKKKKKKRNSPTKHAKAHRLAS
jgi:hypothetical protein